MKLAVPNCIERYEVAISCVNTNGTAMVSSISSLAFTFGICGCDNEKRLYRTYSYADVLMTNDARNWETEKLTVSGLSRNSVMQARNRVNTEIAQSTQRTTLWRLINPTSWYTAFRVNKRAKVPLTRTFFRDVPQRRRKTQLSTAELYSRTTNFTGKEARYAAPPPSP